MYLIEFVSFIVFATVLLFGHGLNAFYYVQVSYYGMTSLVDFRWYAIYQRITFIMRRHLIL